jgi:hypothetical protein
MKVKPLRKYPKPAYPTRRVLDEHPELLRQLPARWRDNPLVIAVISGACFLLPACGAGTTQTTAEPAAAAAPLATAPAPGKPAVKLAPVIVSKIAPVFEHGDGTGAFGCIVVNPPVFLSEEEARRIIVEEAKKQGIVFTADGKVLDGVDLPLTDEFGFAFNPKQGSQQTQKGSLTFDGQDTALNVGYEFVSETDFSAWERKDQGGWASVSSFDFIGTAKTLRSGLDKAQPTGAYAVFYEPAASAPDGSYDMLRAKRLGQEQLLQQVKDFIDWLKAEGII